MEITQSLGFLFILLAFCLLLLALLITIYLVMNRCSKQQSHIKFLPKCVINEQTKPQYEPRLSSTLLDNRHMLLSLPQTFGPHHHRVQCKERLLKDLARRINKLSRAKSSNQTERSLRYFKERLSAISIDYQHLKRTPTTSLNE